MREREGKIDGKIYLDTSLLSDEEKSEFIQGWKDAGGYMGDCDSNAPAPWCMPWLHGNTRIEVPQYDLDPCEQGQVHWENSKDEIAELLAQEERQRDYHLEKSDRAACPIGQKTIVGTAHIN